jgi:hypothetical protein
MTLSAEGASAQGRELFARRAVKDGRAVVDLRGLQAGGECVIHVDVYPVTGAGAEPLHLGPYALGTLDEAVSFVEEALLALEYLGCSIHAGADERRLHAVPDGS